MTVTSFSIDETTFLRVPNNFNVPANIDFEPQLDARGNVIFKRVTSSKSATDSVQQATDLD